MTQDWLQPYLAMNKNQLLNQVDPATLNQIRNTMGDQAFIDHWKLTREDYMRVIEGAQSPPAPQQPAPAQHQPRDNDLVQSNVLEYPQQPQRDLTITENNRPVPVPVQRPVVHHQPAPVSVVRHPVRQPVRAVAPVSYGYPAYTSTVRRTSPVTSTRVVGAPVYSSSIRTSYVGPASPVRTVTSPVTRISPGRSYYGGYGTSVVRRY